MRIVVVGNGRSVHTVTRSTAVAAAGHEVRLVTLGPVLASRGIEVRTRPIPSTILRSLVAARSFLGDIHAFRPDLLHLHYAGGRLSTMATLSRVRPLVVTVMGGDVLPEQHPGGAMSRLERRATRRILEEADLILVKSDGLRPAVQAFGIPMDKVGTVRWGVDPAVFHRDPAAAGRLRSRLGLSARDRIILSPRILRPLYNIHLLVEAMPRILQGVPGAVLLIAEYNADDAYRRNVEGLVARFGLQQRVRFVGQIEHGEMPALYSLADAVVMIPSSDGLPQSLFEAMACETPVVLGRLSAYEEVVSAGVSAVFCDFEAEQVAAAVVRVLGDLALRASLTRSALKRVREVACLPLETRRVVQMYQELVARGARARTAWAASVLDAASLLLRS